jgi:hypothetical protein
VQRALQTTHETTHETSGDLVTRCEATARRLCLRGARCQEETMVG